MSWKNTLTEQQILDIAKRKGLFFVSLRWRDDNIRGKCRSLKSRKLLTGGRRIQHGGYYFYPVKENPE